MVVYPHWRGELEPCQNGASFVPGLSPLARGTPLPAPPCCCRSRFIPAGAGNSKIQSIADAAGTVYPRWRGELRQLSDRSATNFGLSPLARGTPDAIAGSCIPPRFIPAGAGNSARLKGKNFWGSVYPRWRGELSSSARIMPAAGGLSPLARGTQSPAAALYRGDRFIPAGAGNSPESPVLRYALTVYPRWRGELVNCCSFITFFSGLSPLARGTRCQLQYVMRRHRFIPAGAGNSLNITYY